MSIKTILVPLDGNPAAFETFERAIVVARRFGSHLIGLHVMQNVVESSGLFNVPASLRETVVAEGEKKAGEKATGLRERFEEICAANGLPLRSAPSEDDGPSAEWKQEAGSVSELLVRYGQVADMVAVRRPQSRKSAVRRSPLGENTEALMLHTGRPVLVVPPDFQPHKCEHVAIGWNESAEAARALAMALPWLTRVDAVSVLVGEERLSRVGRLTDYLRWHGVEAKVQALKAKRKHVGEEMLELCKTLEADMLVVGGYSHSRAQQLLFGGVTRYLLEHSNVMTVMAH